MGDGRTRLFQAGLIGLAVLGLAAMAAPTATAITALSASPVSSLGQIGDAVEQVTPSLSFGSFAGAPQAQALPSTEENACPTPAQPGQTMCMAIAQTGLPGLLGVQPAASVTGYSPANLQAAYGLATASATGATQSVAAVAAYDDPAAAADLAIYRSEWGLPACDTATGAGCVTKVNEDNQLSPLPSAPPASAGDWTFEESADLDMITAICPNCRILLFEANSVAIADMGQAELAAENDTAFVSNSWGSPEFFGETSDELLYFGNDPGKAIVFAAGNSGWGTSWPAVSPYVTAVGGTTLTTDSTVTRGYTETAWSGTGSGCSTAEAKPSWQTADDTSPAGCLNRTANDVAAVADPATGVAVYDSTAGGNRAAGWGVAGGTGVAASIVTGVYALAGFPQTGTFPAAYPYQSGNAADLNAVTSGSNGTCDTNRGYLCTAGTGYNGPAGLGTPNGTSAFTSPASSGDLITVIDPGSQDHEVSTALSIPITAEDSASGMPLTYTATGLPTGVTINSGTGTITGTPTATGTSHVTVTASDGAGSGSATFNIVVVPSLAASYHPSYGPVNLNYDGLCMDDTNGSTANGNRIQIYSCLGNSNQVWAFQPDGSPGAGGQLKFGGDCLDATNFGTANGTKLQLWGCHANVVGSNQEWEITGSGELVNPVSGRCVTDPGGSTTNETQLVLYDCTGAAYQQWFPPSSPIQSGVAGKCVDDTNGTNTNGNKLQIYGCLGNTNQKFYIRTGQTLERGGECIDATGKSKLTGALIQLWACNGGANQEWIPGPQGQIENVNSGLCLDDPGNTTTDQTQLVQEPCYGQPGEVWAET